MARPPSRFPGSQVLLRQRPRPTVFCQASQLSSSSRICDQGRDPVSAETSMLFLTRCFGVTGNDSERNLNAEQALHSEIVEKVLLMQAKAAAQDHRPLLRGTHAKGVVPRAPFEVFGGRAGRDGAFGARLAQGI